MKRFNWQSGKSYYKVYDGVDNTIKLRKTKFTEYYNQKCLEKFNIEDFENGGLYCLRQQVDDESLLGKKIIISYVDFDLKTGDVIYIEPKLMEYRLFDWSFGKYIHLVSVEGNSLQSLNYWDSIYVFVWDCDKQEEALSDYNRKVTEMIELRKEDMNKRTEKELKALSKLCSKKVL